MTDIEKTFKACGFNDIDKMLADDLDKIVAWQEELQHVDTDNVEPLWNTIGDNAEILHNDDIPMQPDGDVLANAPESEDNFFLVPKVLK